jgi:hypothetical protein
MLARTGLTDQEWQADERIVALKAIAVELHGMNQERWEAGVEALRDHVLALPTRRAMKKEATQASGHPTAGHPTECPPGLGS